MAHTSRGIWYPVTGDSVRPASRDFRDQALTTNAAIDAAVIEASPYKGALPSGADLNDYLNNGTWTASTWSVANSTVNRPAGAPVQPYRLAVYQVSPSITHQVISIGSEGELYEYERYYALSSWQPWKPKQSGVAITLPSEADLNDYTNSGTFANTSWAVGQTILNRPPGSPAQPFRVEVIGISSTISHQVFTVGEGGELSQWTRYRNGNTWHPWHLIFDTTQSNNGTGEPTTDRAKVTLIGDSQIDGAPVSDAVQNALGSDVQVLNRGRGGDTVDRVAIRAGVKELWGTITNGEIPASGSVVFHTDQPFDTGRNISFAGRLADVSGTLSFDAAARQFTFTRSADGTAVTAAGLQQFMPTDSDASMHTLIVWMGGNNSWDTVDTFASGTAAHVINSYQSFMTWAGPQKRILFPGMTYGNATASGAASRTSLADAVNTWLASTYPLHYTNINQWLIDHGMNAAGLADTQDDIDARQDGLMPPSLLADDVHFKPEVRTAIGEHLAQQLRHRGWA